MDDTFYELRPWAFGIVGVVAFINASHFSGNIMLFSSLILMGAAALIIRERFKHRTSAPARYKRNHYRK